MGITRRDLLIFGVAAVAGAAAVGAGSLLPSRPLPVPPRALPYAEFAARCMRCGACVQACHTRALEQRDLSLDLRAVGLPYLRARLGGCTAWDEGCRKCAEVCPSGALNPAAGLEHVRLGVARFNPAECTNCMVCLRRCPIDKAVYFPDPQTGGRWYRNEEKSIPPVLKTVHSPIKPVISEELCVGCGLCVAHCIPKIIRLDPV